MNFIDQVTSTEVFSLKKSSEDKTYHIFLDLLKYFKEELSTQEYMDLYYFHTLCEKCLMFARRRELKSAAVVLNQLHAIDRSTFPEIVRAGAEASFLACNSYMDYVVGNYEAAAEKMTEAIYQAKAQATLMPAFLSSLYEYNLNLIRVAFKTSSRQEITGKLLVLLQALFFNTVEKSNDLLDDRIAAMEEQERETWVHYLLDNFVYGLEFTLKLSRQEIDDTWLQLLSALFNAANPDTRLQPMQHALSIIHAFVRRDTDHYLQLTSEHFPDIARASYFTKKTILAHYLDHTKQEQIVIELHPNYGHLKAVLGQYDLKIGQREEALLKSA